MISMRSCHWNIEQYPSGDHLNFQVWGDRQLVIANPIVSKFKQVATLSKTIVENRIPTVLWKKGN
jgi:hypothetical protein